VRKRYVLVTLCLLSLIVAAVAYAVRVDGRVVDQNGAPQSEVKVELFGSQHYSAWTDASGNFSLAEVKEGTYKAKVNGKTYDVKVDGSGMHPNPLVVN